MMYLSLGSATKFQDSSWTGKLACLLLLLRHKRHTLIHSLAPSLENYFFSVLTMGTFIGIKNKEMRKDMVDAGERI